MLTESLQKFVKHPPFSNIRVDSNDLPIELKIGPKGN
uniref:Uncharacterized protein n=1 Tax=Rhizophora mucronata TaxID=61149 RepID=A0A2P2PQ70_RHIMU